MRLFPSMPAAIVTGAVGMPVLIWGCSSVRSNYAATPASHPSPASHKAPTAQAPDAQLQRAGIAPPHAEGDGLSGVASAGELFGFISVPASFVGGVPVTRAMNPWAMPEASL
jgi:hypothetical protein